MPNKKRLRARVNVGKDDFGKPIYIWASAYSKRELNAEKQRILLEYRENPKPVQLRAPAETFREYAQRWYRLYKEPKIRHTTKTMYESTFNAHLFPSLGDIPITEITTDMLQAYINTLDGKSESLIHKIMQTLQQVFAKALDDELIQRDPTRKLEPPAGTRGTRTPITLEAVQSVTNAAIAHPYGLMPLIMIYAGLRRGEMLGLRWEDIYDGKLHIRRAVTYENQNRPVIGEPKTESGLRDIPLLPVLAAALEQAEHGSGYVVSGEKVLPYSTFDRHWKKLQADIPGLADVCPHRLRYTFLMLLRRAHVDAKTQQYLMGHSDYQTTANIYTCIDEHDVSDATAAINASLPELLPDLLPDLLPNAANQN